MSAFGFSRRHVLALGAVVAMLGLGTPRAAAYEACVWEGQRFVFGSSTKWPRTIHVPAGQGCNQHFRQVARVDKMAGRQVNPYKNMVLDTDPAHGKVALHDNASIDYVPAKGYRGKDAFDLTICNAADNCATVAYTVIVE